MAWRLHLSDRTIKRLDILTGKPSLLAAWTQTSRVAFLDLQTGTPQGDRTFEDVSADDRRSPPWQDFLKTLVAPNGVCLPIARTRQALVSATADGTIHLYQTAADLILDVDGKELKLEVESKTSFVSVVMARTSGLIAALDSAARLHLYQRHLRLGIFETGLTVDEEFRLSLVMSEDGASLFMTDGQAVVLMDGGGRLRKRLDLHFRPGAINCSADGRRFVASDLDANVVRIYDGDLMPTHQRFAVDLLAEAKRSQLLASATMSSAALGPLAINNKGVLAFALSGTLCVTSLARMKAHPKAS